MAADAAKVLGVPPAGGDGGNTSSVTASLTPSPQGEGSFTPLRGDTSSAPCGAPVSLRVGRFADLTRHRPVIQHRGPLKGKAIGGAPLEGKAWEVRR